MLETKYDCNLTRNGVRLCMAGGEELSVKCCAKVSVKCCAKAD